jgi:hypothetical protein
MGHAGVRQTGPAFHHVLAAAMAGARGARPAPGAGIQAATAAAVSLPLNPSWVEKAIATIPLPSDAALQRAMTLEGVPASWKPGLSFIMAQESGGQVNAKNPVHSARGLFQLTAANYHLNPHGTASFGDAVEEAQGGIRYIQQRYGTADNAVAFWRSHHWY